MTLFNAPPLGEVRQATHEERAAVRVLAAKLLQAYIPGRSATKVAQVRPGGRLRMSAAVQRDAQMKSGALPTAKPWVKKQIAHSPKGKPKIAILRDMSSSMGGMAEPSAVLEYMLSNAGQQIAAQTLSIMFHRGVFPLMKPGKVRKDIRIYRARGGTEYPASAWATALPYMQDRRDARILVMFSDCAFFTESESNAFAAAMEEAAHDGVVTVCVVPDAESIIYAKAHNFMRVTVLGDTPLETARGIGDMILDAIAHS